MPTPKHADEADGIYHALNRGNGSASRMPPVELRLGMLPEDLTKIWRRFGKK